MTLRLQLAVMTDLRPGLGVQPTAADAVKIEQLLASAGERTAPMHAIWKKALIFVTVKHAFAAHLLRTLNLTELGWPQLGVCVSLHERGSLLTSTAFQSHQAGDYQASEKMTADAPVQHSPFNRDSPSLNGEKESGLFRGMASLPSQLNPARIKRVRRNGMQLIERGD